jgi:hypothetical protein
MRYKIGCSIFSALIGFGRSKDRGKAGVPVWLVVQIFFCFHKCWDDDLERMSRISHMF